MKFRRIQTNDETLNRLQSQIQAGFTELEAETKSSVGPFIGGKLIAGVALITGQDNQIAHGLGRVPSIWTIVRIDSNSVVWELASSSMGGKSADLRSLNLRCSANCTVSLWVN